MTIRTKLHILAENVATENILAENGNELRVTRQHLERIVHGYEHPLIVQMLEAADYVIDTEVINLLRTDGVSKSIRALCEAGIARLPVSPMVVEFEVATGHHEFVYLHEKGDQIEGYYTTLNNKTGIAMMSHTPIDVKIAPEGILLSSKEQHMRRILEHVLNSGGIKNFEPESNVENFDYLSLSGVAVGVQAALLMLNTQGIEKEIIEVPALNRTRLKKSKPAVPRHTVVHIGRIYRRDGSSIKNETRGGWSMPMHIRQAHTRTQRYGPGFEQTKTVFIPMTIVNFREGDEIKKPKKIIKL